MYAFKDSYSFQPATLCSLSKRVHESKLKAGTELTIVKSIKSLTWTRSNGIDQFSKEKFDLITKKMIFPYQLATDLENLKNITKFPSLDQFNDNLLEAQCVSQTDYDQALLIYKLYNFQNLLEYYMHYCLIGEFCSFITSLELTMKNYVIDVALLAEVMIAFQKTVRESFGLAADAYISLPSLSLGIIIQGKLNISICFMHHISFPPQIVA